MALNSNLKRLEEKEQACIEANYMLEYCKKYIDVMFGDGYAKNNPVILGAMLQSAIEIFIHKPEKNNYSE